jgi:hypothetical protein
MSITPIQSSSPPVSDHGSDSEWTVTPPEDANIAPAAVGTVETVVAEEPPVDATMPTPEPNPSDEKGEQDSSVDDEKTPSAVGGADESFSDDESSSDASSSDAKRSEAKDTPQTTVQRDRYLVNYQIWYARATIVHLTLIF